MILSESAVPQAESLWQQFRNTSPLAAGIGILAFRDLIRKWRISEMEHWGKEYIDLVVPGYIYFDKNGYGEFGTLRSLLHYSIEKTMKLKESIFLTG